MRCSRITSFIFLLALVTSRAWAGGTSLPPEQEPETRSAGLVSQVKNLLNTVWEKVGCEIDPWGRCGAGERGTASPSDLGESGIGMQIDPWG